MIRLIGEGFDGIWRPYGEKAMAGNKGLSAAGLRRSSGKRQKIITSREDVGLIDDCNFRMVRPMCETFYLLLVIVRYGRNSRWIIRCRFIYMHIQFYDFKMNISNEK